MAADFWTFCVCSLLFCAYGQTNGLLIDDSIYSPCDVEVWTMLSDPSVINKQIPDSCTEGKFRWDFPVRTVHLHFPNPSGLKMSVCIRNYMFGNIFTIRDITNGLGFPMLIGVRDSCTLKYTRDIVLRIDAPAELFNAASIQYHVYTV